MRTINRSVLASILLTLVLASCGGGGGSSAPESVLPAAARIADTTAPAQFDFSTFEYFVGVTSRVLVSKVPNFAITDAATTYVTVWYVDAAGERQQMLSSTLQALQALDASGGLQIPVPADVTALTFNLYNAGQTSDEVTL